MKRGQSKESESKSYMLSLSDVFEVVFSQTTKYHQRGEMKEVSLPVAIQFINDNKVSMTDEILSVIKEKGKRAIESPKFLYQTIVDVVVYPTTSNKPSPFTSALTSLFV